MIDISLFLDKLEVLKQFMAARQEAIVTFDSWTDLKVCPDSYYALKNINLPIPKYRLFYCHIGHVKSFEEYYNARRQ